MTKLSWTKQAIESLTDIHEYLLREAPYYADEIVEQLIAAVDRLEPHPFSGRKVPEADRDDIREVIFQHYRIIHWVIDDQRIDILSVLHDSRDLENPDNQPWTPH